MLEERNEQTATSNQPRTRRSRAMPRRRVLTLQETYTMYCEDCHVQGYKEATIIGYRRTLRCFLRWAHQQGATLVSHFTAELVKRYIGHLQAKQKWSDNDHVPTKPELISAPHRRLQVRGAHPRRGRRPWPRRAAGPRARCPPRQPAVLNPEGSSD
jgi:hypothetical protein